jgi:hypothetical protein
MGNALSCTQGPGQPSVAAVPGIAAVGTEVGPGIAVEPGAGVGPVGIVGTVAELDVAASAGPVGIGVGLMRVADTGVEPDAVAADIGTAGPGLGTVVGLAASGIRSLALCRPGRCDSTTASIAVHSSMGSHRLDICSCYSSP